ncbi:MAG TPA: orotate phosphoribosyltransferase [Bacteroidales bacterium]|nr:orotate phosphoribosyltransferase [Bacteroidales bacterium]
MSKIDTTIPVFLLQSKAIKLEPAKPFTWASGWKSPIYCDNRITLSYPEIRSAIRDALTGLVKANFPDAAVVAGVATGAIAQGVLVAQELNLPFVYVRSAPKKHGMENLIEGEIKPGQKVIVVEDLISTGNSSLMAVDALRKAGADVLGMVAIFTYGFSTAEENFKNAGCKLFTVTNYEQLIEVAVPEGYITSSQLGLLKEWRKNPSVWMQE